MSKVLTPDTFTTAGASPAGKQAPDLGCIVTATGVLTCTSGNCSATWRVEGSNDGANWQAVGADVVIGSAASPQLSNANRVQFAYAQYRANCTAITGTGVQLVVAIAVGS
jgi:hypothetical protein